MTLAIRTGDMDHIIAHCQRDAPIEACGILAGTICPTGQNAIKEVVTVYPCRNALQSSTEYRISPDEQIRVFSTIDKMGLRLVGFYHSPPHHSSQPSKLDEDRAYYYGHSYLIIALHPLQTSSWVLLQQGTFQKERIALK